MLSSRTARTSPTLTSAPSGCLMFGEDAGAIGADFEIDLLGFELDERLAGIDRVALLLQPLRDARFDDGFTEFGNNDIGRHNL